MHVADAQATDEVGRALAPLLRVGDVIALSGNLGAGKTSLARGLLSGLGLEDEAPSPSFALVIPYELRIPVWHVDLYRIDDPAQIGELGLDDALYNGALVIEWPERMDGMPWPDVLHLTLESDDQNGRRLTAAVPPSWEDRWPFQ
jgi:tRNA threonylcarbamoyladenosine biosynthesis protein TsaE